MNPEDFREWRSGTLSNAKDLAYEARLLFNHGCLSRAYYLAHMATEEITKSILLGELSSATMKDEQMPKLNKLLRSHRKKIEFLIQFGASLSPELKSRLEGSEKDLISHINDLKNDTMYVSFEAGSVLTPSERISDVPVETHLSVAEELIDFVEGILTKRCS